jgi:hypothetical protein
MLQAIFWGEEAKEAARFLRSLGNSRATQKLFFQ